MMMRARNTDGSIKELWGHFLGAHEALVDSIYEYDDVMNFAVYFLDVFVPPRDFMLFQIQIYHLVALSDTSW